MSRKYNMTNRLQNKFFKYKKKKRKQKKEEANFTVLGKRVEKHTIERNKPLTLINFNDLPKYKRGHIGPIEVIKINCINYKTYICSI